MKSFITVFLSTLLTVAILAPTVITLIKLENNSSLVMDFNEEENNKEEKKELNENDAFFHTWVSDMLPIENPLSHFTSTYIKSGYSNTIEVFLPPPENIG